MGSGGQNDNLMCKEDIAEEPEEEVLYPLRTLFCLKKGS